MREESLTDEQYLRDFIQSIIDQGGADELSEKERAQLYNDLSRNVKEDIGAAICEELSDADVDTFHGLIRDNADAQKLHEFLLARIPELDALTERVLGNFRAYYGVE